MRKRRVLGSTPGHDLFDGFPLSKTAASKVQRFRSSDKTAAKVSRRSGLKKVETLEFVSVRQHLS